MIMTMSDNIVKSPSLAFFSPETRTKKKRYICVNKSICINKSLVGGVRQMQEPISFAFTHYNWIGGWQF